MKLYIKLLSEVIRVVLAGILLLAGLYKISEPESFMEGVRKLLGGGYISMSIFTLVPAVEVVLGVYLMLCVHRLQSAVVALALFSIFLGFNVITLSRGGAPSSCGCMPEVRGVNWVNDATLRSSLLVLASAVYAGLTYLNCAPSAQQKFPAWSRWLGGIHKQ